MTNSTLGYVKDAILALIGLAAAFGWWNPTDDQVGAILLVLATLGAIAVAFNTAKGKPAEIRNAARKEGVDV